MGNSLVSARVSVAKREAARGPLAALGATTSDLINSAFDYLLATKELPRPQDAAARPSRADFARFLDASSLDVDWGTDAADGDYRSLIATGKRSDYESLA